MITELLAESQITLPQTIIDKMGLAIGDLFDISERDGGFFIMPVVVPKMEMSQFEYVQFLNEMCGCIDDPTFVEPPEILHESPREPIE